MPGAVLAAVLAVVLAAVLALAAPAAAVEFSGEATTVFRVFDLVRTPIEDQEAVRTWRPIDQTISLHWDEIGERGGWRVDVLVRGRTDLASDGPGAEDDLDVMLARATWRSRSHLLHLTLGRQPSITGFGWRLFDGARIDFPRARRARFFLFAGLPQRPFDNGTPDVDGFTAGGGATLVFPGLGSVGVDAVVRRFEDVTTEETAGLDLVLSPGRWSVAANADWDRLLDRFGETTALVRRRFGEAGRHSLEARWTRVEPIFPADSIWAIFASNPYTERRVAYEHRSASGLVLGASISSDDYEDTGFPGEQDVKRAAVHAAFESNGVRRLVQRGDVGWQDGFSGSRLGGRYDADWNVAPRWRLGAGASVHRYENVYRLTPEDETIALRFRVKHESAGRFDVALQLEQYLGRDRDTLRGSLVVSTRLGKRRAHWPWWDDEWRATEPQGAVAVPPAPRKSPPEGER